MKEKNLTIETLRGIAILLVVMGHVIGSAPDGGMKIDFPSPFRYIYIWIDYIQMPLFTAIAGFVYAYRPVGRGYLRRFERKKMLRLLIPMAVVGTLYFLMQYYMPGTNRKGNIAEIWRIYVFPFTIYWYLPSLFIMFTIMGLTDRFRLAQKQGAFLLFFGVSLIVMALQVSKVIPNSFPNYFSFKGALEQLPYFILGVGICRFKDSIIPASCNIACAAFATIGIILLNVEWFLPISNYPVYNCLRPILICCLLFLILRIKFSSKFFIYVGGFSYSIYLFHVFFTGGVRIILVKAGLSSQIAIFAITLVIAVIAPIVIDMVLNRSRILKLLFLGKPSKF